MMNRKILAFLLVSLIITVTASLGLAQGANHAAVEKQLLTAERGLNDAIAKGDMKTFHSNLAPDAVSIDGGGIMKVDAEFDKAMASLKKVKAGDKVTLTCQDNDKGDHEGVAAIKIAKTEKASKK